MKKQSNSKKLKMDLNLMLDDLEWYTQEMLKNILQLTEEIKSFSKFNFYNLKEKKNKLQDLNDEIYSLHNNIVSATTHFKRNNKNVCCKST